ncbi:MAG: hypothetical protein U9Q81_00580, partial [Pseudomonadota bacterium]|nr:hypothetical protein [Pseudomonadota bacterium]
DGWTAHMIAYELGMAGDTLAQQAERIEQHLAQTIESADGSQSGDQLELEQRQQLARTLRATSRLLRETAQAIVGNLR